MTTSEILVVKCPHCGEMVETPYVYDGTFEIFHRLNIEDGTGCDETFFVAVLNGQLHVRKTEEAITAVLERLSK